MSDPRHPKSSYSARYPFNQKTITEAGHELEFDNTPGASRIRLGHKSGTYFELSENGRRVDLVNGNYHLYAKGGRTETIENSSDVKVTGHDRRSVAGDQHFETAGDQTAVIGGIAGLTVNGMKSDTINGSSFVSVMKNSIFRVQGQHNIDIRKDMVMSVGNDTEIRHGGYSNTFIGGYSNTQIVGTTDSLHKDASKYKYEKTLNVDIEQYGRYESKEELKLTVGDSKVTMLPGSIKMENGGSSITITDGQITIKSASVKFIKG